MDQMTFGNMKGELPHSSACPVSIKSFKFYNFSVFLPFFRPLPSIFFLEEAQCASCQVLNNRQMDETMQLTAEHKAFSIRILMLRSDGVNT